MALSYFYDDQIRRYIEQVQRVFSNFKIKTGKDRYGNEIFKTIPCVYGDTDRMAQHIKRGNSENTLTPVPFISVYETSIELAPERRQQPSHVNTKHIIERKIDPETNAYTEEDGSRYSVQRFMPVPYNMRVNVDVWFTQTHHKLQIAEQIMTLFNPDINIQTSTNPLDWSALTTLTMEGIDWQSRVPSGTDDAIRMISFIFIVPIYINPPAKITRQRLIHQIITDIYTTTFNDGPAIRNDIGNIGGASLDALDALFDSSGHAGRIVVTPNDHHIQVNGNIITLLGGHAQELDGDGNVFSWSGLFETFDSPLVDNITMLRLRPGSDIEEVDFDFIGRLRAHADANKLYWAADLETIPADTQGVVDATINPDLNLPSGDLPPVANGQRYILEGEIRALAQGNIWNNITANVNDIIEYNGGTWAVVFDASTETGVEYVTDNLTGKKMKFKDGVWNILPDGLWEPGYWRLVIGS